MQYAYEWSTEKLQSPLSQNVTPSMQPQVTSSGDPPVPSWYAIPPVNTWVFTDSPYGDLWVTEEWSKLQYDQSSTYDWYTCVLQTTSIPGYSNTNYENINTDTCYGNGNFYCTSGIWEQTEVTYYGDQNQIITHGPTTTSGQSTFGVNIGVSAGSDGASVNAGYSYSYMKSDVTVAAVATPPGTVEWKHSVTPYTNSGEYSTTVSPGYTVRTPPTGASAYVVQSVSVLNLYAVQYEQPDWFWGWLEPDVSPQATFRIKDTLEYNWNPDTPIQPSGGPSGEGIVGQWYQFSTSATDADGNNVAYWFNWGDGTSTMSQIVQQGYAADVSHPWAHGGTYYVQAYAVEQLTYLSSSLSQILTVVIEPQLTIQVDSNGGASPPTNPTPGTWNYPLNSIQTVTAYPAAGYYFGHWSLDGNYLNNYPITQVSMNSDHTLAAYFSPNPTLTISLSTSSDPGSVTTYPSFGTGTETYTEPYGSSVSVTAYPATNYFFVGWQLDNNVYLNSDNPISVDTYANHNLAADFCFSGGGGGCPYVAAWNGTGYKLDNNIMPQSETNSGEVQDYKIQQNLVPVTTNDMFSFYSLKISEFEHEHDYIDQVKLLAVDHSDNVNVAVSPKGEILTYSNPVSPISAISNDGTDILSKLKAVDGNYYQSYNGSYITVTFASADISKGAKLVIYDDDYVPPRQKCPVYVQTLNSSDQWNTVAVFYTRANWETDIINMTGYLPDANENLQVRLCFVSNDEIEYIGLDTTPQANIQVHQASLLSALSSSQGNVASLLRADDGKCAELTPGQQILLTYILPTNHDSERTFVFFVDGYYQEMP
jgi:hypothetical protein